MATVTKQRKASALRVDPSRTFVLRRKFEREIRRRLNRLWREIWDLIVVEDAFGMSPENQVFLAASRISQNAWNPVVNEGPELASTQVNISDREILQAITSLQSSLDSGDILQLEDQPHVTIRYGIHPTEPERVSFILRQYPIIPARIGRLSLFRNEKFDVLKFSVESPTLHVLHAHLGILPNTVTHPEYNPHLTVAYLQPGTGEKYLGLTTGIEGKEVSFREAVYSSPEREQTAIALNSFRGLLCQSDFREIVVNTRWRFRTNDEQLRLFEDWLRTRIVIDLLPNDLANTYWEQYIREAYAKGLGRAYDDTNRGRKSVAGNRLDFYSGGKSEFISSSFRQPASVEKVKLLAGRVYTDLNNVSEAMAADIKRHLVDGMIQGKNPREIARNIREKSIDKIGRNRSEVIAQTEIMRAHAEGQLDAFEKMGVTKLGVMSEWQTARDDRVCPLCAPLEGITLSVKEARGMIPRHPRCRCVWLPAGMGEDTSKQVRSKEEIDEAIKKSIRAEIPKKSNRSLTEQKKVSKWAGAGKTIAKDRPKSILEGGTPKPIRKGVSERKAKEAAKPKAVKKPAEKKEAPPKPTVAPPKHITYSGTKPTAFAKKVWKEIDKRTAKEGVLTREEDARAIGKIIKEQVLKSPKMKKWEKEREAIKAEIATVEKKMAKIQDKFFSFSSVEQAKASAKLTDFAKEHTEIYSRLNAHNKKQLGVISESLRETLSQVRDFGRVKKDDFLADAGMWIHSEFKKEITESIDYAFERLPDDWLKETAPYLREIGEKNHRPMHFRVVDRGNYDEWNQLRIAISDGSGGLENLKQTSLNSTMLHEMTHAVEAGTRKAEKRMGKLQREFLNRRIEKAAEDRKSLVPIYPGRPDLAHEVGYKDDLLSHYMGKDYGTQFGAPDLHFEIMTMGVEHVFNADNNDSYMYQMWFSNNEAHKEYLDFILGMLAGF